MFTPIVSVIIPLRNRSGVRLINCLNSLGWQNRVSSSTAQPSAELEIIISDFGSDPSQHRNIIKIANDAGATVVKNNTRQIWNRSQALNIGIRASRGKYVMCTDADMIFMPNFIQSALELQKKQGKQGGMVVCQCHDLPQQKTEQCWTRDMIPGLFKEATVRGYGGTGACQFAPRSFFEYVRGYDEGYVFWGSEDKDMLARAEKYGLELLWLDGLTAMAHQWHPTLREQRKFLVLRNRLRYKFTKHRVVKNSRGWGESF